MQQLRKKKLEKKKKKKKPPEFLNNSGDKCSPLTSLRTNTENKNNPARLSQQHNYTLHTLRTLALIHIELHNATTPSSVAEPSKARKPTRAHKHKDCPQKFPQFSLSMKQKYFLARWELSVKYKSACAQQGANSPRTPTASNTNTPTAPTAYTRSLCWWRWWWWRRNTHQQRQQAYRARDQRHKRAKASAKSLSAHFSLQSAFLARQDHHCDNTHAAIGLTNTTKKSIGGRSSSLLTFQAAILKRLGLNFLSN